MPNPLPGGLLAPLASTFDSSSGDIARDAYVKNIQTYLDMRFDGVLVAGSSGEAALLEDSERRQFTEWARETLPDNKFLLVGTGSESTRQTISRCRDAAKAGGDAVLVVAPHYFLKRMTEQALLDHYRAVADSSPLPVMLYNMPAYAHLVLSPELISIMAQHENVIGMKDSAGNLPVLDQYLLSQSDKFAVYTGNGATAAAAISKGAKGAILAIALYAGPFVRSLVDAARAGRIDEAAQLQIPLVPVATEIAGALGPAGIKAAMDLVGLHGGVVRSPLLSASDAERAKVADILAKAGMLGNC